MFTKKSCSVHRISPMYQFLSKLPYFSKQTLFFFFLIDICVECDQTECMNCWMSIFFMYRVSLNIGTFCFFILPQELVSIMYSLPYY